MPRHSILCLSLAVLPALTSLLVQERAKPKEASSVPQLLDGAKESFQAGRFGACITQLNEAIGLVGQERAKAIRAALPAAPEGFEIVPDENAQSTAGNPFAAAMLGGVGNVVQQDYRATGSSIGVTVTADSPLIQIFSMWTTNPAMLEEGAELIKYGSYNAVLKNPNSSRWELQLVIDKTLIEVTATGFDDDRLLKFMNQAAVDQLAAVLAR
jgi:hypothetical protein